MAKAKRARGHIRERCRTLEDRRVFLMCVAWYAMRKTPATQRTLDAFEELTAKLADASEWEGCGFKRQHLRHHPRLKAIYRRARFGRENMKVVPHGFKSAAPEDLVRRAADAVAAHRQEFKKREAAEKQTANLRTRNAVDAVKQFMKAYGLTLPASASNP